jgi:hypothetical protein
MGILRDMFRLAHLATQLPEPLKSFRRWADISVDKSATGTDRMI